MALAIKRVVLNKRFVFNGPLLATQSTATGLTTGRTKVSRLIRTPFWIPTDRLVSLSHPFNKMGTILFEGPARLDAKTS